MCPFCVDLRYLIYFTCVCPCYSASTSPHLQIGSDMTLATVWRSLNNDFQTSLEVFSESSRLASLASAAAERCRELLALEAIGRARGVGFAQMAMACESISGESRIWRTSPPAFAAAQERLRGQSVMIVAERHRAVDGVTEDGDIAIRWNWAQGKAEAGMEDRGGGGGHWE